MEVGKKDKNEKNRKKGSKRDNKAKDFNLVCLSLPPPLPFYQQVENDRMCWTFTYGLFASTFARVRVALTDLSRNDQFK